MTNHYKAFTIIELLVSMLIASIILALAWNVYWVTKTYHDSLSAKADRLLRERKLEYQFIADAEMCDFWVVNPQGALFVKASDTVEYFTSDSLTVRSSGVISDTLVLGSVVSETGNEIKLCITQERLISQCFQVSKEPSSESVVNYTQ